MPAVSENAAKKGGEKKRSPESRFYDEVKAREILFVTADGSARRGILEWVDVYTIGVKCAGDVAVTMFSKAQLASIRPWTQEQP